MSTRLTLTPLPDYAAVRLEVDDAPAGELVILRSDANGQQPVRLLPGQAPASGVLVATDYEPALHGPVTYSVPGDVGTVKGTVSLELPRPVVAVAVSPNLRADVHAFLDGDENSDDGSVVHRILDSPWSTSIAGEMGARTGSLVAWCDSYESAYALREVCSTTDAVLIRHPEHTGMDLYAKVRTVNVSPRGELVADELGPRRRWTVTLGYLEQPAPAGPLLAAAGWSVADVVATFDTVADVAAAFATVRDLTVGP